MNRMKKAALLFIFYPVHTRLVFFNLTEYKKKVKGQ
jgi:hypothetical protein